MTDDVGLAYEELLSLLRGEELNGFEREVADALGCRVVPGWGDSTQLHRELGRSRTSAAFLRSCFGAEREAFRRFTVSTMRALEGLPDEEEYPEGEEPGEDERSEVVEVLGLGQGFSLLFAQYYRFYRHPDDTVLDDWLKFRRVPYRARFRKELKRIFASI